MLSTNLFKVLVGWLEQHKRVEFCQADLTCGPCTSRSVREIRKTPRHQARARKRSQPANFNVRVYLCLSAGQRGLSQLGKAISFGRSVKGVGWFVRVLLGR